MLGQICLFCFYSYFFIDLNIVSVLPSTLLGFGLDLQSQFVSWIQREIMVSIEIVSLYSRPNTKLETLTEHFFHFSIL